MAITFDKSTGTFYLDGKDVTYAFCINSFGYPEHLYFGATIGHDDLRNLRTSGMDGQIATIPGMLHFPPEIKGKERYKNYHSFAPELAFFGTSDYREPAVHVKNPIGDRLTELLYDGHEIVAEKPRMTGMPSMRDGETLIVHLSDRVTGFACDLYYTVYDDASVIARRAVYINGGTEKVVLRRAYSFSFLLPTQSYEALTLYGAWAKERQIERIPLHHGVVSIDSKRCSSSSVLNPFMALVQKGATESLGEAYGFSLVYSSSYVLKAEGVPCGQTLVTGGINDFDFEWNLGAGESFETPEVVIAYSNEGIGGMSRAYHDAYRNHLINPRFVKKHRPLVINNWEGTYFNFNNDKLKAIASAVADTGIDTFVLDDGWFGVRNDDKSGLGDWFVNTDKMEGGLRPVIDHVHGLGMDFGLWFEPEMINEDSDIFRAHPDFAVGVPNRPRCYSRNQYMMDLTREDVRDYIVESVNKILREYPIEYVKWDYNRNVTEFFSLGREAGLQQEFAHRYALGLYDLCERIVEANPNVFFEGCSGGGARFDPAMLYYFPQIWTSDDSDAQERTKIQYGTSIVYPLSAMSCHVSEVPNHQVKRVTPLQTRADIAHLGATGYELDTSAFTDEDRDTIREQVKQYFAMEDLVLEGDLYRTESPFDSNFFAMVLVSKDKSRAHMTIYRALGGMQPAIRFRLAGLDPNRDYYVEERDATYSGTTLMNIGVRASFPQGDFLSTTLHFTAK